MTRDRSKNRITGQMRTWLPRVMFESVLIVASILLALWLDERQEESELRELVDRSVLSFERELTQNKNRIDDVYPYHDGLRSMLSGVGDAEATSRLTEFRNIMDSLQSSVLFDSAWQTALATGALTRMDFELVSALSLTYSMQTRFQETFSQNIAEQANTVDLTEKNIDSKLFLATRFVDEMTDAESDLNIYYQQALDRIELYKQRRELGEDSPPAD